MTVRMIRSLECILLGLLVFTVIVIESAGRPHLPGRPFSLTLLLPSGLLLLGVMLFSPDKYETRFLTQTVFRLRITALATFFLTPFFVWQFPLYEHIYFLLCGGAFLLAFQIFLISLAQVMQVCFYYCRRPFLARASRFTGISVVPLMCTVTVIVYLHAFRLGPGWAGGIPVESPYSIWIRLSPFFRGLSSLPFFAIVLLLLILALLLPSKGCGRYEGVIECKTREE